MTWSEIRGLQGLGIKRGTVREVGSVKELGALLNYDESGELVKWWREGMGFVYSPF